MRQMMGHELHRPTELPPQDPAGGGADLTEVPQEFHFHVAVRPPVRVKFCASNPGIERVCYPVDLRSLQSRIVQTKADRLLGKLVRIVGPRLLSVLDAVDPLFLARRHDPSVDEQGGRRFMIHGVDAENVHPARASTSL